ncbi:MAG: class I SAM-dependent methyltransferase [Planctomycetota bacterium]|nr:class I SAM-dependent methyltransferase [Planctomycetota bacterium]
MKTEQDVQHVHDKEAEFHDQWAQSIPLEQITVREAFEAPTAMENRFILSLMGDIRGKTLLDIGAGLGESSVYFALLGAAVTATDLSPAMVECATKLARHHGVSITGVVSPGESLGVPDSYFDLVYVANTIHHVTDKAALFGQIQRALKPGGRFFSFDPIAYNPVINVYRKMASQVRTEDEAPLTFTDAALAGRFFQEVGHREFWIASLALFVKYYLIDRVHPNADRYWKRIFKETRASLWWWLPLRGVDAVLTRLPLVRRLSWNMVMWGRKADSQ